MSKLFEICPECGERTLKTWLINVAGAMLALVLVGWLFWS